MQILDSDPDALLTEIALVRLEAARSEAQRIFRLKATERAPAVHKLRISPDFDDRLTLALFEALRQADREKRA